MSNLSKLSVRTWLGLALVTASVAVGFAPKPAAAAPVLRFSADERGDLVVFGNTLAHDCRAGIPMPVVGAVGTCGTNTADSAVDVFWRADDPLAGQARADNTVLVTQARSSAQLQLPAGASVVYARLYWQGQRATAVPSIVMERPGVFQQTVNADAMRGTFTQPNGNGRTVFSSTADVSTLLQRYGAGSYRLNMVTQDNIVNLNDAATFANWYVVVFYRQNQQPPRSLSLLDGFDTVGAATSQTAVLRNFLVPAGGFDAKLAAVAHDGDFDTVGDALSLNGMALTDALNPANNFFNSTHSYLGAAVTTVGDLPQYDGKVGSLNGLDLDVVDIAPRLKSGDTQATVLASTSGDGYFLSSVVGSVSTFKPIFSDTSKTWKNLTRADGSVRPGDTIEYTVVTHNTGIDTGVDVTVRDTLPAEVTYQAGSISIDGTARTDAAGDDQAETTVVGGRTVVIARLGTGATAALGGAVKVSDPVISVRFRVTVNNNVMGLVSNQAVVSAVGQTAAMQGVLAPARWNSGDGKTPSAPTVFQVGDPTDLAITITDNLSGQVPVPGASVVYTVVIKNNGPRDVTTATFNALIAPLPVGMISWTCMAVGGTCPAAMGVGSVNTNALSLTSGGVTTYLITVPVGMGAMALRNLAATVTIQPPVAIPDILQSNNTASMGLADLAITVTDNLAGRPPVAGSPIVYTVTVQNNGPSGVQDVALSNVLPAGVMGTTWTCAGNLGALCPSASGVGGLPAAGGTLISGSSLVYTVTIPGSGNPPADPTYSVAVAAPSPLTDPMLANNAASTAAADLQVTLTDSLGNVAPQPGSTVSYTLTVTNAGPSSVTGAQLSNTVPKGFSNLSWTCLGMSGAVCPAASGSGAPELGNLALPSSGVLSFIVTGQAPALVELPWSYSVRINPPSLIADPNLANNSASAVVQGSETADLSIRIVRDPAQGVLSPGQLASYSIFVSNAGPQTVTAPTVALTFPANVVFTQEPTGDGWTCSKTGSSYSCTRADIAMGDAPVLVATLQAPASAGVVVAVVGAPRLVDPTPANNLAVADVSSVAVRVADLALRITKSPDPSVLGTETTYNLQLNNKGPDAALAPILTFSIPASSIVTSLPVGDGWSCTRSNQTFTCVRADAPVGDAPSISLALITPAPADGSQNAGAVIGQVSAVQTRDPDLSNNLASVSAGNVTPGAADLSIALSRTPELPGEGELVRYTVLASNKGPGSANNVLVTLQLPAGAELVESSFAGWSCQATLSTWLCTLATLAPGEASPIAITVRLPAVSENDVLTGAGGAVANVQAADNADPNLADNSATLAGTPYKVTGGGFSCTVSSQASSANQLLAALGLLLLGLATHRQRLRRLRADCARL